ncbi:hypothetical protein WJT86_12235 [Microvirga sp. W0021]|uniref:Uncharacterized protein n=1 Tax=Hohaiivirga grylli TaxID=3133970 RepID=A0ABV0BLM9_9HYPH
MKNMNLNIALYLKNALDEDSLFPKNVFSKEFNNSLFFEADLIFSENFVDFILTIMEIECVEQFCLLNMDETNFNYSKYSAAIMGNDINKESYLSLLKFSSLSNQWLYSMQRYSCCSSSGNWVIYCERMNDIAVISFKQGCNIDKYKRALDTLKALPIKEIVTSERFPFNKLVPSYQEELIQNY